MKIKNNLVLLLVLTLGSIIFYIIGGLQLSLIYIILWVDRVIIGRLNIPWEFGIEFFSIPAILVGLMYGPGGGFLFALLVIPIIWGIIDFISAGLGGAKILDLPWEPFLPSFDSLVLGITALIGGILKGFLPFFYIAVICIFARFFMRVIKDLLAGTPAYSISYLINAGLNILIVFYFQNFFISTFGLI